MLVWFLRLVVSITDPQGGGARWPEVRPVTLRVPVDLTSERVAIDVPLKSRTGRVAYHFACRGGSEAYLDSLPENWVGPLMCTLAEGSEASELSLLSEDESPAWFSRGLFNREDPVGDCAAYPEFGIHRSFRLRGFRLRLDAEDVRTDRSGVAQSFVLVLSLVPDADAKAAQAEQPGFLDPRRQGRSCRVVVPGREPRMCRDWQKGGSWGVCKH
jgi:hypothetical protein